MKTIFFGLCSIFLLSLIQLVEAHQFAPQSANKMRSEKLKQLLAEHKPLNVKYIMAKIELLTDSTGLVYVGAKVNKVELLTYLAQMKKLLGAKKYQLYRDNQIARDRQNFHVTLINPFEYQKLIKQVQFGQTIQLTLHGLGRVEINDAVNPTKNAQSYFVVTSSNEGQYFRQQYLLKKKNFHITLGFDPHDIYTKSKGMQRLISCAVFNCRSSIMPLAYLSLDHRI